ncbi:MAG TPA: DUF1549 domain-containing protein [Gemmataceae bacterium]|nr:DUF1549 domain-containing protein [Gemmataceae bacterium]
MPKPTTPATRPFFARAHLLAGAILCLLLATPLRAAVPTEPAERAKLIGQPVAVTVEPATLNLTGPRAMQQIVVTGRYADGSLRDLTPLCDISADPVVVLAKGGFVLAAKNGTGALTIKAGGQSARVPVTVKDFDKAKPVSFRHELIAVLNVGGCNAGACHGTPSGKNGFKLSLRGYDPEADYLQLTRDVFGRRTDRLVPEASLIYLKALGRIPHEGGQRFQANSIPARFMKAWLTEGLKDDAPTLPKAESTQILPGPRVASAPSRFQQIAVLAKYSDGTVRDVTRLTNFSSSDSAVAEVSNTGLVEFSQAGEVAILCRYLDIMETVRFTYLEPRPGFKWPNPAENNYVDKHIFAKLKLLSIPPSDVCTDEEFVRRAFLDLCGILPTPEEVKSFVSSKEKDKREKLIDTLLARPEYADYWTLKWSDVLRSNRKTIQLKGIHVLQQWVRGHVRNNTGFDAVVRELLTANGSTFTNPPANYYRIARDPQNLAETTAQLFMGVRMQCAKCHNHPFERWTQDDYYSMAAFFARVRQMPDKTQPPPVPGQPGGSEVIFSARTGEVTQPRTGRVMPPKIMGLPAPTIAPGKSRRDALAEVMTSRKNTFFARSVVNRIWYHLNGKGIVDPVDDFRDSNPSANDELLDALAKDFVEHKYDVKHMIRVIMTSRTYQLSAQTSDFNKDDNKYFSHAVTKLLPAEPLLDAICTATEVFEKFPGLPNMTRAVQLPDGEVNHPFLKTFGQPARELACECERESDSNLAQALQLINGPTVNDKLRAPTNRVGKLLAKKLADKEILNELYLATLSRLPNAGEVEAALGHVAKNANKRSAWEDVHWALINSKEFLFRH